jgi:hypothetical protein
MICSFSDLKNALPIPGGEKKPKIPRISRFITVTYGEQAGNAAIFQRDFCKLCLSGPYLPEPRPLKS